MKSISAAILLSLSALPLAAPAAADTDLPGVSPPEPIVTAPAPEAQEDGKDAASFRIGNTEIRMRAEITVDVTAGGLKASRRR
jgi:hypothetical protein